jgi:Domain of unknown function (DUF4417)
MKNSNTVISPRLVRNGQTLWDDADIAPGSLGCVNCVDRVVCGGAHKQSGFFHCGDYCRCVDKAKCDLVCREKPSEFTQRVREVRGLDLMNAPRTQIVDIEALPSMVPLIEHSTARVSLLNSPIVALPLYALLDMKRGTLRYSDREALSRKFLIDPKARLVISGVARDLKIERYWAITDRPALLAQLRLLEISLITPPNYSLLTDVPRTDNLHSMKRILITTTEMLQAGLPAALHVNARTERDYQRWAELIADRPEIQCVAFEFATGTGRGGRLDWHVAQLNELAAKVPQPLRLVVRGGVRALGPLRSSFSGVTVIDTAAFTKTRCRQHAYFHANGQLAWRRHPTALGAPIDELLQQNVATLQSHHTILERAHTEHWRATSTKLLSAPDGAYGQAC